MTNHQTAVKEKLWTVTPIAYCEPDGTSTPRQLISDSPNKALRRTHSYIS